MNAQSQPIPVVDVDNAFPAVVQPGGRREAAVAGDVGPQVTDALRDILGWRPRSGDYKAFEGALSAAFRLRPVEGHTEVDFVPRGYAVQADLGAVTGGQASLYRRAMLARTEALRILDGLTPLRPDADLQDMEAYRLLVRNAADRLVSEIGLAGGPRVEMVDMYFAGLTGSKDPIAGATADTVSGQLGALRDRFGLVDDYVNTVDDEGIRTAYWTLFDLVADLQGSWARQKSNFIGVGQGFLGTELILLSRIMEAAAEQVEDLEDVLDSVLIGAAERRTLMLDKRGLTLDGLLTWLQDFLSNEGRRLAQDGGRDGIVSGLAPMAVELVRTFKDRLADPIEYYEHKHDPHGLPVTYLPTSSAAKLPPGMYAARTRVAVASLGRLLMDLARSAQSIARWAQPVLLNVTFSPLKGQGVVEVEVRGFNLQPSHIPAFVRSPGGVGGVLGADHLWDVLRPLEASATSSEESVTAIFRLKDLNTLFSDRQIELKLATQAVTMAAEALPLTLIDGQTGTIQAAQGPVSWPNFEPADKPVTDARADLAGIRSDLTLQVTPTGPVGPSAASPGMDEAELIRQLLELIAASPEGKFDDHFLTAGYSRNQDPDNA